MNRVRCVCVCGELRQKLHKKIESHCPSQTQRQYKEIRILFKMSWIPEFILPKWLLLVGTIATFSGLQSIADTAVNRKVYTKAGASITPLSARLFGVWNLLSAVIRIKCAYDIHNGSIYQLTMFTFALALAHFSSEIFVYKTAVLNSPGTISPLIVASSSFLAMALQYHYYVV